jgi:hypothetical protein
MPVAKSKTPIMDRIADKYVVNEQTKCWMWARSRSSQGKYPTIGSDISPKTPKYVHQVMWESVNGPVPTTPCPDGSDRWELHHRCFEKTCINPNHVVLLSRKAHAREHRLIRSVLKAAKKSKVISFPVKPVAPPAPAPAVAA